MFQKLEQTLGGLKLPPANQREETGDETANKKTDAPIDRSSNSMFIWAWGV